MKPQSTGLQFFLLLSFSSISSSLSLPFITSIYSRQEGVHAPLSWCYAESCKLRLVECVRGRSKEGEEGRRKGTKYLMRILNRIYSQSSGCVISRFHCKNTIILTFHHLSVMALGPWCSYRTKSQHLKFMTLLLHSRTI